MTITNAILLTGGLLVIVIVWSSPVVRDYHTDLKNIAYQLSRVADALNRKRE